MFEEEQILFPGAFKTYENSLLANTLYSCMHLLWFLNLFWRS